MTLPSCGISADRPVWPPTSPSWRGGSWFAKCSSGSPRRRSGTARQGRRHPANRATAIRRRIQLESREEVERLLDELQENEARVVRMYHLEGKSYQEITAVLGIPENSIGPILTRARSKMRRLGKPAGRVARKAGCPFPFLSSSVPANERRFVVGVPALAGIIHGPIPTRSASEGRATTCPRLRCARVW